jgi:hypothetical protein
MKFNFDREKLSAIGTGGITPSGGLYFEVHEVSVRSEEVVQYLEQLLRQIDGHVVVLWDGLPRHRSAVVRDFARDHGERLTSSGFLPLPAVQTSTRWSGPGLT